MRSSRSLLFGAVGVVLIALARADILAAESFSQADGLPAGPVTALAADDAGRLWVGGKAGLRVMAGGRFVVEAAMTDPAFTSPIHSDLINELAVDAEGRVWAASAGTLYGRTADGRWHEGLGAEIGLTQGIEAVVPTNAGVVWAGGENAGLARFDGTSWEMVDRAFRVTHLTVDHGGVIWAAGGKDGTVLVSDPSGPNERRLRFGEGGLPDAQPQALVAAADDGVWVGTNNGLVHVVDGSVVEAFDRESGLPSPSIFSLAVDRSGAVWVGTAQGLARIEAGRVDATVGLGFGVSGSEIFALTVDRSGDLWAGGQTGVVKLPIRSWQTPGDPVNGFVSAAGRTRSGDGYVVDDGELLMSGSGRWEAVPGLGDRVVTTAVPSRSGALLVGTDSGWGSVRNGAFVADDRCCVDRVNALLEDDAGRVWVGTSEGLVVVGDVGPVATFRRTEDPDGLGQDPVTDLWTAGASTVWAATLNGGATPFIDLRPGQRVSVNTTSGALGTDLVDVGLVTDTGDLWLGTSLGLRRRVDEDWATVDDALGRATALLETGPDRVWVGTESNGLALVSCELLGPSRCVASFFDESDGLASRHITSLELHDGELWVGTARGLTRHTLDSRAPFLAAGWLVPPKPGEGEFTELRPGDYQVDGRLCNAPCDAKLPHDARTAEISLLGADVEDPGGLRYLVESGSEREVVDSGEVRLVLEPGQTFNRTAIAFDRHFNQSAPASLSATTDATPWYLQPLVWAVVAAGLVVAFSVKYRYDRRDRLAYRDALIAVRSSEAGYEASIAVGAAAGDWRPIQIDTERADALEERVQQSEQAIPDFASLGDLLYRSVLSPFEKPLRLRADRRAVRLSLDLEQAPDLEPLPWELVHGGDELEHLTAGGRLAIVRRVGQPARLGRSRVRRPLRVLVAWATPTGLEFDAAAEYQAIVDAVKKGGAEARVKVEPLEHVQRLTLSSALNDDVDVLHFIGHGGMGSDGPVLLFEGPKGDQHPINGLALHRILLGAEARTRRPRLVVLSACRSAESAAGRGVTSLAAQLVAYGDVSAAIGMGYEIYTETAGVFSGQLYASLVRHGQIEHAVAVARGVLRSEFPNSRDWLVPRLYAGDLSKAAYDLDGGG